MNKNEKLIMMLPLETENLIIKKTSKSDIELIMKMDKQELTQKYLGGIKNKTREERLNFLEKKERKFIEGKASSLTVYLKEDNIAIGFIGLNINEEKNIAELSYIFDYDYSNKGYCTEASKKLVEIGLSELKLVKIIAETVKGNESSKKVLEKLGFKYMRTRKELTTDNNYVEFLEYHLLNE